jgi:hypothetical protein
MRYISHGIGWQNAAVAGVQTQPVAASGEESGGTACGGHFDRMTEEQILKNWERWDR